MLLEVRHLRMIEAIDKEGGVSGAAKRLHVTQPAISHALRDLEGKLGVQLFRRENRRMIATPEADRLLQTANVVLDELVQAERDLARHKEGRLGVLRLATQCYTCYHWLPRVLKLFSRDFPGIEVQIVPDATRHPVEALLADNLDLAVVSTRPDEDGIVAESLFSDEMVAIVAPNHALAARSHLHASDFADQHLMIHTDKERSAVFTELLTPAGVSPQRVSELQLTEAVVEMIKAGLGISVMARWAVEPELAAGTVRAVRLTANGLQRTWYAAMLERNAKAPGLAELTRLIRCCGGSACQVA